MIHVLSTGRYTYNISELLLSNISDYAAYRGATRVSEGVRVLSALAYKSSIDEMKWCFRSRRVRVEDG